MNRDNRLLEEALKLVSEKKVCVASKKGCACSKCAECRKNKEKKSVKESLNECWDKMSDSQKKKVEQVLQSKNGYKIGDNAWSDSKKTVTLTHELGNDAERDIIVDDKGEEVVHTHSGPHEESLQVQENKDLIDPNNYSKIIDDARKNLHDNKAHGRLAAANFLRGNKEGFATANPHPKDSPASQNWQEGFDEVMSMSDKANTKAVEDGEVPTKVVGTEVKESRMTRRQTEEYLSKAFAKIVENSKGFEEQMPDSREKAESAYGVNDEDAAPFDESKSALIRVAKQITHCLTHYEDSAADEAEVQEHSSSAEKAVIHVVIEDKGYTLTVEPAKY
jgi:hypothetical protein